MRNSAQLFFSIALFASVGIGGPSGCSHRTEVTTTDTVSDGGSRGDYHHEETETRTVEKDTGSSHECGGVLSCAVDTLGSIIAFPFKAVGALIGAIF